MVALAEILRAVGPALLAAQRLLPSQRRAVRDILSCRTPALGGQLYRCDGCGEAHASYHSCRNRHCPQCQTSHAEEWLEHQRDLLLPTPYLVATCTLPQELRALAYAHQRTVYSALMQAAARAALDAVANPRFAGGRTAVLAALHTWTRALLYHPHVHMLLPEGGLAGDVWRFPRRKRFPIPSYAIGYRFRSHLREALVRAGLVTGTEPVFRRRWVAHVARVGSGEQALLYLSRYVFSTAISNQRIDAFDGDSVTFHWTESRTGNRRSATLPAEDFVLRFLQHVLPRGFTRIRYYGLWAPACRQALETARQILEHHQTALGREKRERVEPTQEPAWPRCPSCGAAYGRPLCRLPRQRGPP